jgi:hypothetical protein
MMAGKAATGCCPDVFGRPGQPNPSVLWQLVTLCGTRFACGGDDVSLVATTFWTWKRYYHPCNAGKGAVPESPRVLWNEIHHAYVEGQVGQFEEWRLSQVNR